VQTLQQTQDVSRALAVIADTMGAYSPSLFGQAQELARIPATREGSRSKPELLSV